MTSAAVIQHEALDLTEPGPRRTVTGSAVQIDGLGKSFADRHVVTNLSLDIAPGEFVAIVGPSGCGKTTLLRLVAGLEQRTEGLVTIDGSDIAGQAAHVRLMFQDARLLPWKSVLDNVGIGQQGDWCERALVTLKLVDLAGRGGEWPSVLSGGQRQRVALARALISRPRLLLLDEPLGALDALTRLEMQLLIERVWFEEGFTAMLVTHDVGEAVLLADRVVLMEKGAIGRIWTIDQPRPRRRRTAHLAALEDEILQALLRRERPDPLIRPA